MSAQDITLASGAQTATGQSDKRQLKTATMGLVSVNVTAATGTTPKIDYWLEASFDGGTTWVEVFHDGAFASTGTATDITITPNKRNINATANRSTAGKDMALYRHMPAGWYRLAWVISGTTPSFTFTATLSVK